MTDKLHYKLLYTLQNQFKFSEFRPGQCEAITELMTQGRLLCIQPTGHGKSLLYQLPATILDGITLVISPLLALMRDQLTQLINRFNIPAASINTDQSYEENYRAKKNALAGNVKILFIAPEQLDNLDKFEFLMSLPIQLLVVDEAHCISTWGHDFRPSYRQIIRLTHALIKKNNNIKLLALTATADAKTELDIKQQLSVDNKKIIIHRESMYRSNISLSVIPVMGLASKLMHLSHFFKDELLTGCGLIYCATRENTELVAEYLAGQGISTTAYHAGMEPQRKQRIQHDFLCDKFQVISATNALGMGIDKSNLRFIIHFDVPGSITAYYQEVGRAGRDGLPADGILLYDPADTRIQRYFIESSQPSALDFQLVLNTLLTSKISHTLTTIKRLTGLHPTRLTVIMAELIEQGYLHKKNENSSQIYQLIHKGRPNLSRYENQLEVRKRELKNIQRYAEQSKKCLMLMLRHALGDNGKNRCDKCNVCSSTQFKPYNDHSSLITIASWLERRIIPISLSKKISYTSSGIAALDGKLRSPLFIQFMQERANTESGIADDLMKLIQHCFADLKAHYQFGCVVPLPSRTWKSRDLIAKAIAEYLNVPAILDCLNWEKSPQARQGELFNNDQRKYNVINHMRVKKDISIPKGVILLLDDYIGTGYTLNEAARSLRELSNNEIVPFTIAAIKWRLGKTGMI